MHPAESAKDGADGYMEGMIFCKILLYFIGIDGGSFLEERSDVGNNDSRDTAMSTRLAREGIVRNPVLAVVLQCGVDEALLDA